MNTSIPLYSQLQSLFGEKLAQEICNAAQSPPLPSTYFPKVERHYHDGILVAYINHENPLVSKVFPALGNSQPQIIFWECDGSWIYVKYYEQVLVNRIPIDKE